jgi:hypothetical protein
VQHASIIQWSSWKDGLSCVIMERASMNEVFIKLGEK